MTAGTATQTCMSLTDLVVGNLEGVLHKVFELLLLLGDVGGLQIGQTRTLVRGGGGGGERE